MTNIRRHISYILVVAFLLPLCLFTLAAPALAAPAAPRNVTATNLGNGSVRISVSGGPASPTGPLSYVVYYSNNTQLGTLSGTSGDFYVGAGRYVFYVESRDNTGPSNGRTPSNSVTVTGDRNWGWGWGWNDPYYYNRSTYTAHGYGDYNGYGDMAVTINAHSYKLERVGVDRQTLSEGKHYTVSSGRTSGNSKTIITFKESFLRTLSRNSHDFSIVFSDGTARFTLRVYAGGSSGSYATVVGGDGVTLRSATIYNRASSKGKKLGTLEKNISIDVRGFSPSGTYAIIRFGDQDGYIKADYVNAAVKGALTGRTSSSVYLYTGKSTKSSYEYAKVSKNTVLDLLGREGSYWRVRFNNETLFVRAKYIRDLTVG